MARPLRIEFPGALYQVTSRGIGQADMYLNHCARECSLLPWVTSASVCTMPPAWCPITLIWRATCRRVICPKACG